MKLIKKIFGRLLCEIANLYLAIGRIDKAIALYKRVIELDPNKPSVSILIAADYSDNNNYEKAKLVLEKALVLNPNNWMLNRSFIDLLYEMGSPVEIFIPYIRTYFKHKPTESSGFPGSIRLLARLFKPNIDWDARIRTYENSRSQWDLWAYGILKRYEDSKDIEDNLKSDKH